IDIDAAANTFTVTGAMTDYDPPGSASPQSSSLIKTGAGTLVLSGNNSYSGSTWVQEGTLQVAAGSSTGQRPSGGAGDVILQDGTSFINAGNAGAVVTILPTAGNTNPTAVTVNNSGTIDGTGTVAGGA